MNLLRKVKFIFWILIPIIIGIFGSSLLLKGSSLAYKGIKQLTGAQTTLAGEIDKAPDAVTEFPESKIPEQQEPFKVTLGNISDAEFTPPTTGKMIRVNLKTMQMYLYQNGAIVDTLTVVGKGKIGSYWETPGGEYKVQYKENNHFSSTGKVWMPYSMQFFGNYFIHGWPYYPNGKEVPAGFSGGCIRLKTEDAKKVYGWSDTKTLISIYSDTEKIPKQLGDGELYYLKDQNTKLNVSAKAYLVGDVDTGEILLQKNKDTQYPIASVTKLMTALTEMDVVNQQNSTVFSKKIIDTYGTNGNFHIGEKIKTSDLVYPLLLESSNDAAEALAAVQGRSFFLKSMNEKAKSIGLTNTFYDDPSGLSPKSVSTPIDLFRLARYIQNYKSFIYTVSKMSSSSRDGHVWKNISQFYKNPQYLGGKSGFTDQAGETQVALFSIPVSEFDTRTIAIVVLGSHDRLKDVQTILDYLKKNVYFGEKQLNPTPLLNNENSGTEDAETTSR